MEASSSRAWEATRRSLGFICRERPSPRGARQGSDTVRFVYFRDSEKDRGQIRAKEAMADGDHCPAQNVPGPSLALWRVPGQGDT